VVIGGKQNKQVIFVAQDVKDILGVTTLKNEKTINAFNRRNVLN